MVANISGYRDSLVLPEFIVLLTARSLSNATDGKDWDFLNDGLVGVLATEHIGWPIEVGVDAR